MEPPPKFTSFRPKRKLPEPVESPPPESKKHKPHKHEEKSRPDSSRKREKSSKERETERPNQTSRQTTQSPSRHLDSDFFFSDRRGDPGIVKYGTVNSYEVPRFRTIGHGHVLGLPPDYKIDRKRSTDKVVVINSSAIFNKLSESSRKKRLLTDRHALKKRYLRSIKFIKAAADEDSLSADFIAVSRGNKRRDSDLAGDDSEGTAGYRQLDNYASGSDPDAEYESETESAANSELAQRNATLERQTRENPEDVNGWLNLIAHQEAMMTSDHISELTPSDRIQLAKVRISIYEQALKKFDNDQGSQAKLYGGLMSETSHVWESSRRADKWTEILKKFPLSTDLWLLYLNDVQSNLATFTYDRCRDAFLDCLKALRSGDSPVPSDFVLYIIVRLTTMISQAGYYGMAVGIWQAILEFILLRPCSVLKQTLDEDLRSFEEFWDSDVARVGEEGATGWHSFKLGSTPRFPGRSMDEFDEDDVLNIVLFSDIEEILKTVPRDINVLSLLNAFLSFCQLPPIVQEDNVQRYQLDPFLQDTFAEDVPYGNVASYPSSQILGRCPICPLGKGEDEALYAFTNVLERYSRCPLRKYQTTTELLFQNAFSENCRVVGASFVGRVLELAANTNAGELIGVYILAFESTYFPSDTSKTAKRLIKARPMSFHLYNAYGLAVEKQNHLKKAEHIFRTALSKLQPPSNSMPLSAPGSLDLFSNWVWQAIRSGDHLLGLWRLTSPSGELLKSEEEPPSQAALLRTRNLLSGITVFALVSGDYPRAVTSTSLSTLLEYLSQPSTIHTALSVHSSLSDHFKTHPNPSAQELHAQSIAALLAHHTEYQRKQREIVKPSLVRHTLEPFLQQFPSNTILLSLYAANEARFTLENRVRDFLHNQNDVVSSAFAIHHERLRAHATAVAAFHAATLPSEDHDLCRRIQPQPYSVRAVFTSVSKAFPHCPAVRKAHAEFELAHFEFIDEVDKPKKPHRYLEIDRKQFATQYPLDTRVVKRIRTMRQTRKRLEEVHASGYTAELRKKDRQRLRDVYTSGFTKLPWHKGYMLLGLEIADVLQRSNVGRENSGRWKYEEDDLNIPFEKVMFEKGLENRTFT